MLSAILPTVKERSHMATSISHVQHVPRDDGQRVFDLRITQGASTGYLLGVAEAEQEGITDAFLSTGYAVLDHIGQVLGDTDPATVDRWAEWLIREEKEQTPKQTREVVIAWRKVYMFTDETAETDEEAVENAKRAMIADGVMTEDDMEYLRSLRGDDGYWEVTVGDRVVEGSKWEVS